MKNKDRKNIQKELAQENINFFLKLLENKFNPLLDNKYINEIKKLSQGFNIRLKREEKLKFCKKCDTYLSTQTREIRLNPNTKTKEYICKNCGYTRKFKY